MCKMGSMCGGLTAVLILAAGAVLLGNVAVAGWTALQVAGGLFVLVGLGKLVHCCGMCGMCSMCNTPSMPNNMPNNQKMAKK